MGDLVVRTYKTARELKIEILEANRDLLSHRIRELRAEEVEGVTEPQEAGSIRPSPDEAPGSDPRRSSSGHPGAASHACE